MRELLTAALALKPLSFSPGVESQFTARFRTGEEVVLCDGPYRGSPGIFAGLRKDANWADVKEPNGEVRSHPMVWLCLAEPTPIEAAIQPLCN